MKYKIPAGEFKSKCLNLMDKVEEEQVEYIITKHGRPVARLVPLEEVEPVTVFGSLKSTITIQGDIIAPIEEEWSAES